MSVWGGRHSIIIFKTLNVPIKEISKSLVMAPVEAFKNIDNFILDMFMGL